MPLAPPALAGLLTPIFTAMAGMSEGGDDAFADGLNAAMLTYLASGVVNTVDAGSGVTPPGAYAGKGTGTLTHNGTIGSLLAPVFIKMKSKPVCEAGNGDDELAQGIASAIDTAVSAPNMVTGATTGVVTTPPFGVPAPGAGTIMGKFTGDKSVLESSLKVTFKAMKNMTSGGDVFFANQLALHVTTYLLAGTISVTLAGGVKGEGAGKVV